MFNTLKAYLQSRETEFDQISEERKRILGNVSSYIARKLANGDIAQLVYICTHNSRRSHFGQVWAQVAAHYYNVNVVKTFSGGTVATAVHANTAAALRRTGLNVIAVDASANPKFEIYFDEQITPIVCFSKTYDHDINPQQNFAAIMTCSDAEENCPFIPGVDVRIATTYNDPKISDGTTEQDSTYDERCAQIARECMWVMREARWAKTA